MVRQQHDSGAEDERGNEQDTVEADSDPLVQRIQHDRDVANEEANFARERAKFAAAEYDRAEELAVEHRDSEAQEMRRAAIADMHAATIDMEASVHHQQDVTTLEKQRKQQLSVTLREMSKQSLETLRDAVNRVTEYVENLTPDEKLTIGLNAGMDAPHLEEVRGAIISRGRVLDQTLASEYKIKHDPITVIEELIAFTAAMMTIADHFEPLLKLAHEFGQLLLQFHI